MEKSKRWNVQVIVEGESKWPFVGKAYVNKNGSVSVYLDEDATLPRGSKLYLREAKAKNATPAAEEASA